MAQLRAAGGPGTQAFSLPTPRRGRPVAPGPKATRLASSQTPEPRRSSPPTCESAKRKQCPGSRVTAECAQRVVSAQELRGWARPVPAFLGLRSALSPCAPDTRPPPPTGQALQCPRSGKDREFKYCREEVEAFDSIPDGPSLVAGGGGRERQWGRGVPLSERNTNY
jgi:hypothetical protein